MAVLGSLRRNSFVLIAVIGMALFAFVIAGVFDGNSFQSQEPIGEVNGETLSLNDFRKQVDVFQKQYNFSDIQALTTVWDQAIRKELLNQKLKKLDLVMEQITLNISLANNPGLI